MAVRSLGFARVGPVHFQPIDLELSQVREYFSGDVLNAGCGYRDLTQVLQGFGAASLVNIDIATDIPGAILGSLDDMPFESNRFDTVLCNAVLEHVEHVDAVMAELCRVLKPGGRLIVSIPFLQPFHASPTDFRRFTCDGMRQLGQRHDMTTLVLKPVHSLAQTLGWILWEHLVETGAVNMQKFWRPIIWLATRWSYRSHPTAVRSANTFQAVYEKPTDEP